MKVREVVADLTPRLAAAAGEVADLRKQLDVALQRRDALIVQARTEGMTQVAIARAAKVSQPHIIRVLAAAEPGLLLPS